MMLQCCLHCYNFDLEMSKYSTTDLISRSMHGISSIWMIIISQHEVCKTKSASHDLGRQLIHRGWRSSVIWQSGRLFYLWSFGHTSHNILYFLENKVNWIWVENGNVEGKNADLSHNTGAYVFFFIWK